MTHTVIPEITPDQWAQRQVKLFPEDWTSYDAKNPGGVLYSLFKSFGVDLERTIENVEYDRKASRIKEAIDSALDAVAKDFFGVVAGFPADITRNPSEPDESFRNRIIASLLLPAATRPAMIDLLTRLVHIPPRVMEPWKITDTCSWDNMSYWDVDTPENPFRWGSPELKYQGFVESQRPTYGNQGNNPIYCWDAGFAWDTPQSCYFQADPNWFLSVKNLDRLVNKTKVFGTTVWRKYFGQLLNTNQTGGTKRVPAGIYSVDIDVFPKFAGAFSIIADTTWNTSVEYEFLSNSRFRLTFSTPPPNDSQAYYVDWIASPITYFGSGAAPFPAGDTTITIGIPAPVRTYMLFALAGWNTAVWISNRTVDSVTLNFDTPAPTGASFSYLYIPPERSGTAIPSTGDTSITIPISAILPFQALILPNWNTPIAIQKTTTDLTVSFGVAAPAGAQISWGIHES